MDEIWERAVETALDGQTDHAEARSLTLDGAVKCVHGRLPPPGVLEKFQNLHHLSIANIGVSSLEQFPRLRNLQRLILSDNRIAGGLEYLVEAGLESLRDLDLSNNRIQYIDDLAPLAQLKLVSLDLYECPVTRVQDYRSRVFGLIKSLKYLDKMDAEENERPESDDEDEEEEEEDEDDPGSGEIDGEERPQMMTNGHTDGAEGIVDVDEDEESDADEETEITRQANGHSFQANGFRVQHVDPDDDDDEDDDDDDDDDEYEDELNDSGEEVNDDEDDDDDDVVEVHGVGDSDEDGVEDDDEDDEDEEEEVDNDFAEPESTGRLTSTEGEIDAHEQGEEDDDEDDEDDNGETGEEEQGVEDDAGEFEDDEEGEDEDEEYGGGYLVQPVSQTEEHDAAGVSDMEHGNEENDAEEEDEVEDDGDEDVDVHAVASTSQAHVKRKRNSEEDAEDDEDEDEDEDEDADAGGLTKKQR